ncbi:MAG: hypothetical protein EPN47_17590 [Acidobacteria bacterium]|jgi:hypothetical protein|nr:MAG: hypothetical protein EPN47_17590 [Acidobacteriota bacterium]
MKPRPQSGAHRGLQLPRRALRRLTEAGIYVQPSVSLEYQQFAKRYVVRGVESGGAVEALGRYVTFCGDQGEPLPWLHPLDGIGVNGVHALVIAPSLVRVEMFRRGQTYDLSISRIAPGKVSNGKRPPLERTTIFHAEEGFLAADLAKRGRSQKEIVTPTFYSRAGEPLMVPNQFEAVMKAVTAAVLCFRCTHSHYLRTPEASGSETLRLQNAQENFAGADSDKGGTHS